MATLILVHGAWHGPWCWERLVPHLEAKGHTVLTPTLPGHDTADGAPATTTLEDYGRAIASVANGESGQVVLVVGVRLGCINHALLSVESIVGRGLALGGWVANLCDGGGERVRENIDTLTRMIEQPCLAEFPHSTVDDSGIAGRFRLDLLGI